MLLFLLLAAVMAAANAQSSDVKLIVDNVNANAELIIEKLDKNTDVLKQILEALRKKDPSTSRDCSEIFQQGELTNGKQVITLPSIQQSFEVFCDMKTDGGGWTVFQRRGDFGNPKDYFAKTWIEYKNGFGEVEKEFWLGNDRISALTQQKEYVLRVDLWDSEGDHAHAKYSLFKVDNEQMKYKLSVGGYSGNAGDSMNYQNGMSFSTKDRDNDRKSNENCSAFRGGGGGWWFNECMDSNLNGLNVEGGDVNAIVWLDWKSSTSMSFTEMKLRPVNFSP